MKPTNAIKIIKQEFKIIKNAHISAYSAMSAFFVILSFFPIMIMISGILGMWNFRTESIEIYFENIFRKYNMTLMSQWIENIFADSSKIFTVGFIVLAWSAGRVFVALQGGFSTLMGINERINYIKVRIRGIVISVLFTFFVVITMIVGVFGEYIINCFGYNEYNKNLSYGRKIFEFVFVYFAVVFSFVLIPSWGEYRRKYNGTKSFSFKSALTASFVTDVFMYLYTGLFSFYPDRFSDKSIIYGGLMLATGVMIWLYGLMYIGFLGFGIMLRINDRF